MGDTGFKPLKGLMAAGGDLDDAEVFPFVLSSSIFLPSFQKSLFLGLVGFSSPADSTVCPRAEGAEESFSRGAAESFDSVLGALTLSLTEGSFEDIMAGWFAGCGVGTSKWVGID